MTASTIWRAAMLVAALKSYSACGQWSFNLDTSFVSAIVQRNANSLLLADDGRLVVSGIMRFSEELPATDYSLARLNADGTWDQTFFTSGYGGGRLNTWQPDRFYVRGTYTPRRVWSATGQSDNSFAVGVGVVPYFLPTVGGDYHVYPDGSLVISGTHTLSDTARGFVGQYRLVWFSNQGYLDTTRTHRQANGTIWEFKELPDGKFICTCSCTQYEGQPVSRLFRIHADGSLDTTFNAGVNWGNIFAYHPLPDGRVYVGGRYKREAAPNDTLYLARFMPDGSLDPTFNQLNRLSTLPGMTGAPKVLRLYEWMEGRLFVTGVYQRVNGEPRGAICVVDSSGSLTPDMETCMPSAFSYQGSTNAAVVEMLPIPDGSGYYICGTYSGYTDGTTNDPDQRFVSRLLVSELSVGAPESPAQPSATFAVYPNPTRMQATFNYHLPEGSVENGSIVVRDIVGRTMVTLPMAGVQGQQVWELLDAAPGTYLVHYLSGEKLLGTDKLIIQR